MPMKRTNLFIIVSIVTSALLTVNLAGCSKDKPQVRILNQRNEIVDVQLKRQSGNTYNFNDIGGNSTTGYTDLEASSYEVDVKVKVISASATTFFSAGENETYTIIIQNTKPPTVRVVKP